MWTRYDLKQFATLLEKDDESRKLSHMIQRLGSLWSIKFDLDKVQEMTIYLVEKMNGRASAARPLTNTESLTDLAFFTTAVILYMRCCDTTSDVRGHLDLLKCYDKEQSDAHERIDAVRNTSLAHFGPGQHPGGPWSEDNLFLFAHQQTMNVMMLADSNRANYRGKALVDLHTLAPFAAAYAQQTAEKLQERVLDEINLLPGEMRSRLAGCEPVAVLNPSVGPYDNAQWVPVID